MNYLLCDYTPIKPRLLLDDISKISSNLSHLSPEDKASYIVQEDSAKFNLEFKLIPESIEDLFVEETLSQENELILKVKKADFLGDSMWEFRFGDRNIDIKFSDKGWLEKFQTRGISLQPGDAIRGIVRVSYKYDSEHNMVGYSYDLLRVIDVISVSQGEQPNMFSDE